MIKKVLIVFILCFSVSNAVACTCVSEKESLGKKVKKAFEASEVIFTGNVIAKKIHPQSTEYESGSDPVVYTFEIINPYKNTLENKTIEVVSVRSGATCGYTFEIGKTYLVYARTSDYYSENKKITTSYTTGLCDRNNLIGNVKKRELNKLNCLKNI